MSQILTVDPLFERLSAKERKFKEVIVFVHHYGGHKYSFKRHMEFVNELGFDAVTFNLPSKTITEFKSRPPISREWRLGLRHIWADKIEDVLVAIEDNKIIYSFSSPSMAALMAIGRRHALDVNAWICDGGPFKQILRGFENLVREGKLMENQPKVLSNQYLQKYFVKIVGKLFGFDNYDKDADRLLKGLPQAFPVLSLRAEKDLLVGPDMIDDFFAAGFGHLDFQRVTLHNSEHLLGFRQEPEIYKDSVAGFLTTRATPL